MSFIEKREVSSDVSFFLTHTHTRSLYVEISSSQSIYHNGVIVTSNSLAIPLAPSVYIFSFSSSKRSSSSFYLSLTHTQFSSYIYIFQTSRSIFLHPNHSLGRRRRHTHTHTHSRRKRLGRSMPRNDKRILHCSHRSFCDDVSGVSI